MMSNFTGLLHSPLIFPCCINQHHNQLGGLWCGECESLMEGALIGDYRVISHISKGSSSDVYLAEQDALNQHRIVIMVRVPPIGGKMGGTVQLSHWKTASGIYLDMILLLR